MGTRGREVHRISDRLIVPAPKEKNGCVNYRDRHRTIEKHRMKGGPSAPFYLLAVGCEAFLQVRSYVLDFFLQAGRGTC